MRWDPNKNPPGGNLFFLIGDWTHCFTILFSYWFSITTIKNPIVPTKKKRKCHTNPIFWGRGVLVIGRRDYKPTNMGAYGGIVSYTPRNMIWLWNWGLKMAIWGDDNHMFPPAVNDEPFSGQITDRKFKRLESNYEVQLNMICRSWTCLSEKCTAELGLTLKQKRCPSVPCLIPG